MPDVFGNTAGLPPSALRALERIYRRRVPGDRIATPELVRSLAECSNETKRQGGSVFTPLNSNIPWNGSTHAPTRRD